MQIELKKNTPTRLKIVPVEKQITYQILNGKSHYSFVNITLKKSGFSLTFCIPGADTEN